MFCNVDCESEIASSLYFNSSILVFPYFNSVFVSTFNLLSTSTFVVNLFTFLSFKVNSNSIFASVLISSNFLRSSIISSTSFLIPSVVVFWSTVLMFSEYVSIASFVNPICA